VPIPPEVAFDRYFRGLNLAQQKIYEGKWRSPRADCQQCPKKYDGVNHRSRDSDDQVQFPTTLFKIIFANDTRSATVLNSRGLGVEMSYARGIPSIFRAIRVTVSVGERSTVGVRQ
jgi:hypothetical protein